MVGWIVSGISAFLAILRNIPRLGTVRALAARIGHPTSIALDNGEISNGVLTKASVSSQTVEVFTEDGTVIIPISRIVRVTESVEGLSVDASSPFTVLNNELAETIDELGGVHFVKKELLIPNSSGLDSYKDIFKCTRPWDASSVRAKIRPAKVKHGWQESELRVLPPGDEFSDVEFAHTVSESFLKGQKYERLSEVDFPIGTYLVDPSDWFEHVVRHFELKFSFELVFPERLVPDAIEVIRVSQFAIEELIGTLEASARRFHFEKQYPRVGEKYCLRWINSDETRKKVAEAVKLKQGEANQEEADA